MTSEKGFFKLIIKIARLAIKSQNLATSFPCFKTTVFLSL